MLVRSVTFLYSLSEFLLEQVTHTLMHMMQYHTSNIKISPSLLVCVAAVHTPPPLQPHSRTSLKRSHTTW
uniref:Putative secreted peptide n=1 Tax=Anopheles braziliensis TaxID=58242 RepID=A0A2M3ZN85_9DIPT